LIFALAWIPLNAFAPTVFLERYGVFIVIFFRFLHLKNACVPIFLILDDMTTHFNCLFSLNAFAAIELT